MELAFVKLLVMDHRAPSSSALMAAQVMAFVTTETASVIATQDSREMTARSRRAQTIATPTELAIQILQNASAIQITRVLIAATRLVPLTVAGSENARRDSVYALCLTPDPAVKSISAPISVPVTATARLNHAEDTASACLAGLEPIARYLLVESPANQANHCVISKRFWPHLLKNFRN